MFYYLFIIHHHFPPPQGHHASCYPMHSPSQNPVIHSYYTPFSLLARHSNLFSLTSPSQYQSTSSAAYPISNYLHTPLSTIMSFFILSTWPNQRKTSSLILLSTPFITLHNSLIHAFRTLSIFLIPSKPVRLSICTALILDLSFSFYIIVSLPYIRTGLSNISCKTLAHSSYKPLTLTRDLITLLPEPW